jgi:hypothetical protein
MSVYGYEHESSIDQKKHELSVSRVNPESYDILNRANRIVQLIDQAEDFPIMDFVMYDVA